MCLKHRAELLGAKEPVAGISQAGQDIAGRIRVPLASEPLINGGHEDLHARVGCLKPGDTLRSSYQENPPNIPAARPLKQIEGGQGRATGGQHRIQDDGQAVGHVRSQLDVVLVRVEGLMIAPETNNADLGPRHKTLGALQHAHACPQNWDEGEHTPLDAANSGPTRPAGDPTSLCWQIPRGFVEQKRGNLRHQIIEVLGWQLLAPEHAHFMGNKRMIDNMQTHEPLLCVRPQDPSAKIGTTADSNDCDSIKKERAFAPPHSIIR